MAKRANSAGFTLVETLIALSVFALIALGGVALLDVTVTTQERLTRVSDETRALQRMQAILRSDFGQMVERQSRNESGVVEISATPQQRGALLEFARLGRLEDPEAPRPFLEKIRYSFEDGVLYRTSFAHSDGAERARPIALLEGLESVQIQVFSDGRWAQLAAGMRLDPLPRAFALSLRHRVHGLLEMRYLTPSVDDPAATRQATLF
ncbi:MAG: type II secretion system minor pseudopilin GspJ [Pseudomonadota bacterium]